MKIAVKRLRNRTALRRTVHAATLAAATALSCLSGASHASAATGGFPEPDTAFVGKETVTGKGLCLTDAGEFKSVTFTQCSDSDSRQQWYFTRVDENGFGLVTNAAGGCVLGRGMLGTADIPACKQGIASARWTQLSDGRVVNAVNGLDQLRWCVSGSSSGRPTLAGCGGGVQGDPFDLIATV
ncbi:hypothetical protein ACFU98_45635 [Streptomyces sp. NPDC057575]|uniref:hypothetical protein n=1 Tax=unclassified Streptomyces TaxID=2593676 RepID=UPI003696AE6C